MSNAEKTAMPLTANRKLEDFPVGNVPLKKWAEGADAELKALIDNCRYPWDVLGISEHVLGSMTESENLGEIHPAVVVDGVLKVGKGSRILSGVVIEGNVVIGENCKIGPNCYLRGTTSIGNNCHIGHSVEIKSSVILDSTNVGHLSYVGDSILGEKVNFGAGTMVSNFRHDEGKHHSMVDGELVNTGRLKFGVIVGDGVHTGIGTLFYPGRKIWPGLSTLPGDVVRKDVMPEA